jgi:hypothetical protein
MPISIATLSHITVKYTLIVIGVTPNPCELIIFEMGMTMLFKGKKGT